MAVPSPCFSGRIIMSENGLFEREKNTPFFPSIGYTTLLSIHRAIQGKTTAFDATKPNNLGK
jgi:hypothetical protein